MEELPAGYRLGDLKIETVLGQGGFGITYLARDVRNTNRLAVKEYFPSASATRTHGVRVGPRSMATREDFDYGLQRFRNEAKMLARFDHANIVRVLQLLDINDTAYIIMSFEDGATLECLLDQYPGGFSEPGIVALFRGVVDGLELVHRTGHLHRDLAPDNIIVRGDDVPVIVDFGAARCSYGQKSRSLEAIIKSGYSPPEQYVVEYNHQGVWTDIYALGAIAYRCIGGPTPPASLERQSAVLTDKTDPLISATSIGRGRYSTALLKAIDKALALSPRDRPTSAAAWFAMFAPAAAPPPAPSAKPAPRPRQDSQVRTGFFRRLFFGGGDQRAAASGGRWWILTGTDSHGAPVRLEISEAALRRSGGHLTIGRDGTQSNITIADHSVSRRHAVLWLGDGGLLIEDANSRNGMLVDGRDVPPLLGAVPVGSSTRLTLGGVELVVSVLPAAS